MKANTDQRVLVDQGEGVRLEDFRALMTHPSFIFMPSRDLWPACNVNARLAPVNEKGKWITPANWLKANAAVDQMTWAPGRPLIIENSLIDLGGWIHRRGCAVCNLYRPPTITPKDGNARPWLELVHKVFPAEADHIVKWLAQRAQHPEIKINHALVLGGKPGIGKDTIPEPAKQAIGPWNFADVSPKQLLGRFNGFLKSVILRISEARDLGDTDRYGFYDAEAGALSS